MKRCALRGVDWILVSLVHSILGMPRGQQRFKTNDTEETSTPQKVIAYGISRGRAGLDASSKERSARPCDTPYAITF